MPENEAPDRRISANDSAIPEYHEKVYQGYLKRLPKAILDTKNITNDGIDIGTHRQIIVMKIKYYQDVLKGKLPF